jgi:hypothetical protein
VLVEGPLNNLKPSMMQLGKPKKASDWGVADNIQAWQSLLGTAGTRARQAVT